MNTASNKAADLLAASPLKVTPLEDFYSEEFRSAYCVGQKYTLRASDDPYWEIYKPDHKTEAIWRAWIEETRAKLAACFESWLDAGKVKFVAASEGAGSTARAQVAGTGTVT